MKYLFLGIGIVLVIASLVTVALLPENRSAVPVLYWVTDANPARTDQIRLFHRWQLDHGHVVEHAFDDTDSAREFLTDLTPEILRAVRETQPVVDQLDSASPPIVIKTPKAEMRVDSANTDQTKKIVQGVSGVGGDVMDMWSGGGMRYFDSMALLMDVTDIGKKLGFSTDRTFPALEPELAIRKGDSLRQFQFPCNVVASQFIVNKDAFARFGHPLPPVRWTLEEFEAFGKSYVEQANPPGQRLRNFLADGVPVEILRRSLGLGEFNETATRCTLDDPRNVRVYRLVRKWSEVDRILPTASDRAGFATESGYGGANAQLFNSGNYAMMWTGRYLLISYRKFNIDRVRKGQSPLKLTVVEAPHGGFPNTNMATRAAAVYAGTRYPDLAPLFLAFLASDSYSMQIVRDADSLPPDPAFTHIPEYLSPATDPALGIYPETELELHQPFARVAEEIGIGGSYSPFILHSTMQRLENEARERFNADRATAEQAAADAARMINDEILRTASESPRLKAEYERLSALQRQIDQRRAAGQKVPLSWILDPFHRAYYQAMGWAEVGQ